MLNLRVIWDFIRRMDWILLIVVLALVGFGLVQLYSLGANTEPADLSRFTRQIVAGALGLAIVVAALFVNYRVLGSVAPILYGMALALLVLVLLVGVEIRGTVGWLSIAGVSVQPVEIVKIFFIVYVARFFADRSSRMHKMRNIGYAVLVGGVPALLVLLQPDLGSAIMIIAIWLGMLIITGIKRWQLGLVVGVLVATSVLSFFFVLSDEQKSRLLVFLDRDNPEYALGIGYNVDQSITAVGSGQLMGRGLGLGSQSQLNFLPEQETDFIFAVISEEFGFLGSATVLVLIGVVLLRIARAANLVRDDFAVFLCWGVFVLLFVQSVINIGMNIGLAPVTGLPLPFISAGGTSLLAALAAIGIIQSVVMRRNQLG